MKKIFFVLLSQLCLMSGIAEEQKSSNPFCIDDATYERYIVTQHNMIDSVAVMSVADSLDREGVKQNDKRLRLMAADLRGYCLYMRYNIGAIAYIDTAMMYSKELNLETLYYNYYKNKAGCLTNLGHIKEALEVTEALFEEAKASGNPQFLLSAYAQLASTYEGTKQFQNAIEQYHALLDLIEKHPDAKAITYRLRAYRSLGMLYYGIKDYASGEKYLELALAMDPNLCEAPYVRGVKALDSRDVKEFKRQYKNIMNQGPSELGTERTYRTIMNMMNLAVDGKTEEALKINDEFSTGVGNRHSDRCEIYQWANDWENAFIEQQLYMNEKDSINAAENRGIIERMTAELQTIYETKEKEEQLLKQKYMLISSCIGLVALLLIAILLVYRNIETKKKNRALVANINQLLDMRKREQMRTENNPEPEMTNEGSSRVQIFISYITKQNRFCKADFDRDAILSELHLQKNNFWKLFEEETGTTIQKYLLNLRMEYAAEQIRQHPEYTIEAIAADCGIPSRATFYRNFATRFGITPTVYREQCNRPNDNI